MAALRFCSFLKDVLFKLFILLKLIACFVLGVFVSTSVLPEFIEIVLLSVFFGLLAYLLISNRVRVLLAVFCCLFLTMGMISVDRHFTKLESLRQFDKSKVSVRGVICDVRSDGSILLKVSEIDSKPLSFNMLMRFSDIEGGVFSCGDVINSISSFSIPKSAGYYGDFSWEVYYMSRGIYAVGTSSSVKTDVEEYNISSFEFYEFGFRLRNRFLGFISASMPSEEANVLSSILFGSKIYDDDFFYDKVKYIGAAHAFAISGFNIGILIVIFTSIFRLIFTGRRIASLICIFVLVVLYLVIGYSPPVARAIVMGIVNLVGDLFVRRGERYTTLAISALCILLFYPMTLFDVSFLLSFVSSFFIMSFSQNNFSDIVSNRLCSFMLNSLSLCFFCSLGNVPITAYFFNTLSVGGFLSDLLVVPLIGIIVYFGYIFAFLGILIPPAATIILYPLYLMLHTLRLIVDMFGSIPHLTIEVPSPSVGFIVIYYFLIILVFELVNMYFSSLKQKKFQE